MGDSEHPYSNVVFPIFRDIGAMRFYDFVETVEYTDGQLEIVAHNHWIKYRTGGNSRRGDVASLDREEIERAYQYAPCAREEQKYGID